MSIQSEIERIRSNVRDALETIAGTGVTVGSGSDALPAAASAMAAQKQTKARVDGRKLIFPASAGAKQNTVSAEGAVLKL